jgi:hypothetical protein
MKNLVTIEDAALEQVTGGLSFSIGFDTKSGLTASSPLGDLSIPNPFNIAKDLFTGASKAIGDLISKVGTKLVDVGQLFNFS